jgi:hypothetical protein
MPTPDYLKSRTRHLEPPAFPDGILLERHTPQYKSYRRWWRKRGFWEYHDPTGELSEISA